MIWDERSTQHRARPYDYNEPRIVRGTRIAGEASEQAADLVPGADAKEALARELAGGAAAEATNIRETEMVKGSGYPWLARPSGVPRRRREPSRGPVSGGLGDGCDGRAKDLLLG